jgi:hypothetical protein
MFDLPELIEKIDTLQIAEENDALKKPEIKISEIKSASRFLCGHIHAEILEHYPEQQRSKFPLFNADFANLSFNLKLLSWYKSHAYYLAYLVNKNNPLEMNKANIYLTMAEQHGFPFVRTVEFYKEQCIKISQAATAESLQQCYVFSRTQIRHKFTLNTAKGRFLDLLMIIQTYFSAQKDQSSNYRNVKKTFYLKIEPALKIFEEKLKDKKTAKEFEKFFATGALHPHNSSAAFIAYVKTMQETSSADQVQNLNVSTSTSSTYQNK